MKSKKNEFYLTVFLLLIIAFLAFFLRFKGILDNHPFWIDEFSSAAQSQTLWKEGFTVFTSSKNHFEHHNITTYFLIGSAFGLFGVSESSARIPFVIIGSFIPLLVFFLSRLIFGIPSAISASLLVVFSYFQITWSRQAREFMLLQAITVVSLLFYYRLTHQGKKDLSTVMIFIISIILGILTHTFFLIFIAALVIDFLIFSRKILYSLIRSKLFYITMIISVLILYKTGSVNAIIGNLWGLRVYRPNNLWYYHAFLWREYGLITFLGFIGLTLGFVRYPKKVTVIALYIFFHLIFICFFWQHYLSKYILPIFPFLLLGMAFAIYQFAILFVDNKIADRHLRKLHLNRKRALVILMVNIFITLFIVANGHKFVTRPKSYYSVNHDFREIANIDYDQVYGLIKQKGKLEQGKTALIDTWHGRIYWYIGANYQPLYLLRWKHEQITVIGQKIQRTPFFINKEGNKIIPKNNNLRLLEDVADLKKVLSKYPKGFIYIDDTSLPKDVREYAENNFKKELYLDHYPLDDNPYSIWPATLYSWGI